MENQIEKGGLSESLETSLHPKTSAIQTFRRLRATTEGQVDGVEWSEDADTLLGTK